MLPLAFIILIIIAVIVMYQSREKFTETSYYYEAAPGARGARMVCMPENRGMASLGIAVTKAARYAAKCSGVAKVNHSTINMVGRKAAKASKPRARVLRSTQAVIRPVKKAPRKIRALTASAAKPCTTCKPKKFTKTALKTRKLPAALQAAVRDPVRPKKVTRIGKKLGSKKVAKKPKTSKKLKLKNRPLKPTKKPKKPTKKPKKPTKKPKKPTKKPKKPMKKPTKKPTKPPPFKSGIIGGMNRVSITDPGVVKARTAVERALIERHGSRLTVTVLNASKQIVAGTNWRLTVRADFMPDPTVNMGAKRPSKQYMATVFEALPVNGGALKVTTIEEDQIVSVRPVKLTSSLGQAGRIEWPELQGTNAETARAALAAARRDLSVEVIGAGEITTANYVKTRVRITKGTDGKVARVPRIG